MSFWYSFFPVIIQGHIWFVWFPGNHTSFIKEKNFNCKWVNDSSRNKYNALLVKKHSRVNKMMSFWVAFFPVIIQGHIWFVWFPGNHTSFIKEKKFIFKWVNDSSRNKYNALLVKKTHESQQNDEFLSCIFPGNHTRSYMICMISR